MKIRYKKKRLYASLALGIIWIAFGAFVLLEDKNKRWHEYGYLVFGVLYFATFLFDSSNQYLSIENGIIKKNAILGKKLKLNEIIAIKKFAGDYTLMTENKKMTINTTFIDKESLAELNQVLDKLELAKNI